MLVVAGKHHAVEPRVDRAHVLSCKLCKLVKAGEAGDVVDGLEQVVGVAHCVVQSLQAVGQRERLDRGVASQKRTLAVHFLWIAAFSQTQPRCVYNSEKYAP